MDNFLNFVLLALLLGIKHSFDADHLVAVSNLLSRCKEIKHATKISLWWAIGHIGTATIITIILFWVRETFLTTYLKPFEYGVGAMIVGLGVWTTVREFGHKYRHDHGLTEHGHTHIHPDKYRQHKMMFGIGIIHGLASNDELLLLVVSGLGAGTLGQLLAGIVIFSGGVVMGMTIFSCCFTFLANKAKGATIRKWFNVTVGLISVIYGAYFIITL